MNPVCAFEGTIARGLDLETEVSPCPLTSGAGHIHRVRLVNYLQRPLGFKLSSTPDPSVVIYGQSAATWELEFEVPGRDELQPARVLAEQIRHDGAGTDPQVALRLELTRWALRPPSTPDEIDPVLFLVDLQTGALAP